MSTALRKQTASSHIVLEARTSRILSLRVLSSIPLTRSGVPSPSWPFYLSASLYLIALSRLLSSQRALPLTCNPIMATFTNHNHAHVQPVCQNCATSTTPLWRRDESGSVLCNACGLFLKLHGTARPISLKTDVIKSRNRVKTSGPPQKRKVRLLGSYCRTYR